MDEILKAIVSSLTGAGDSIFSDEEKKVIALANIAHNNAVAVKRGRPIFASNVVKDIGAFERMGGGTDILGAILPLLISQAFDKKDNNDDKVDKDAEAPAWAHAMMDRLDKLEKAEGAG